MGCGWWCVMLLVALLVCVLLGSCKTVKEKDIERVEVHDTVRMVTVKRDSVVRYDSVFVNQYTKGDTVYRDKDVIRYAYIDRVKRDTVYLDKVRIVEKEEEKEVEKKQKPSVWWHLIAFACGMAAVVFLRKKFGR